MTNAINELAQKYQLEEGKTADWYKLHGTPCLTKKGAEKLKATEGITFTMPQPVITDCSVAFTATFTDKNGKSVHEIGSCRWDGQKNTPEKTHAHEMAWKRLVVRGVIALVAPAQGIYGDDEFTSEFKENGGVVQAAPPVPQQQTAPQFTQPATQPSPQPAAQPQQQETQYVNNEAVKIPPEGTEGWFTNAEKLPTDWNNVMGRICELTKQDRAKWEKKLFDHGGVFQKDDGSVWVPSDSYGSFTHMVFATSEYQGKVKSKARFAFKILKTIRELADELEQVGRTAINVPNGRGGLQAEELLRSDQQPQLQAQPQGDGIAADTPPPKTYEPDVLDDVPF